MGTVSDMNFPRFPKKKLAVSVKNVNKTYGGSDPVLQNISMNVKEGIVYGLLGSSGCGKTTLLSCIVGLKKWDSGSIVVMGNKMENDHNGIIARNIGYMPQDVALYEQLTVTEMLKYYAKLYDMSNEKFQEQLSLLEALLNLPHHGSSCIMNLSGGQKRRVSLALTLLHSPKLLILDEPTVGLDPLLRVSIWEYLYNLTNTYKTTIIITTHYIEEVKNANMVGVMRKGALLVEEDPASLMEAHQTSILEEVVLEICRVDRNVRRKSSEALTNINTSSRRNSSALSTNLAQRRSSLALSTNQALRRHSLSLVTGNEAGRRGSLSSNPYWITDGLESVNITVPKEDKKLRKFLCFCQDSQADESKNSTTKQDNRDDKTLKESLTGSVKHMLAYSQVVLTNFFRHPIFIFLVLFLPPFQLFSTGVVLGVEPKYTPVGIVNHEIPDWKNTCAEKEKVALEQIANGNTTCDLSMISCDLIRHFSKGTYMVPVEFASAEDAEYAVSRGNIIGYIQIPDNYSTHMVERAVSRIFADIETINGTTATMHMDMSGFVTMFVVLTELFRSFGDFIKEITAACDFDLRLIEIPFFYREPVFGHMDGTARDYALPALIAGILFEVAFAVTPLVYIHDVKLGTLERSRVAGLKFTEMISGLFFTMTLLSIIQAAICYVSLQFGLGFDILGSLFAYFVVCFVTAFSGGAFGLVVGIMFKDEFMIVLSAIFIIPILMLYAGIVRPIEIIPHPYRTLVFYFFPTAAIVKPFRFIMNRGVSLIHPQVWPGILVTLGWGTVFSLVCLFLSRRMTRS